MSSSPQDKMVNELIKMAQMEVWLEKSKKYFPESKLTCTSTFADVIGRQPMKFPSCHNSVKKLSSHNSLTEEEEEECIRSLIEMGYFDNLG